MRDWPACIKIKGEKQHNPPGLMMLTQLDDHDLHSQGEALGPLSRKM